ncbi:MAG: DUF4347 domain-containing protein, partial [Lentisphaeria bacterium]|nr:DUF4347 domain-containing protein [Lentisphaeria bacterium]
MKELEFFKLENRVLFEAAAAAEIVDAAEMAQNPQNANVSESEKQEQEDREALKNAPPENPAANQNDDAQADPGEIADIDAVIEQLIEGEIPSVEADGIDIDAEVDSDIIEAEADDFIDGEIVDNGLTISTDKELVVINSTVADKDAIIAELKPDQEVLILEDGNGLDELNEYLDNSDTKYSAIHFVTHGNDGYISVNGELIDSENFDAAQWQEIGEHLTEDGDILLYGCDTAATAEGKLLTEMISEASGADVAA